MSKFNAPVAEPKVVNRAGGEAYEESAKLQLLSLLLTSFLKDQFYRSKEATLDELRALLGKVEPRFAAKAAIYARTEIGMRSVSHVVAGELAHAVKGERWMKPFISRVVHRVDDMTEIMAYYTGAYGKRPIPHSLKDGLASAFGKFNTYQLAKYRAEGKGMSLVDLANLVHPKPAADNTEALAALMRGTLTSTGTWEAKLTKAGQEAENDEEKTNLKAGAWKELVSGKKIGYFALLRNLRNILEQAPDVVGAACEMLVDEQLIRKSLVLPFRFSTALEQLQQTQGSRPVVRAISQALDISLANVPKLAGKTLIAVDHSGSMVGKPMEIASLFGAVLYKTQDADLMLFHDHVLWMTANPADSTASIAAAIIKAMESRGTNFHSIFQAAKRPYDRIIILSDMQAWMTSADGYLAIGGNPAASYADYRKRTGANPHIYSWDLQGYGSLQFPESKVYAMAGWSEKVFDLMALLEQDREAIIRKIEAIEL